MATLFNPAAPPPPQLHFPGPTWLQVGWPQLEGAVSYQLRFGIRGAWLSGWTETAWLEGDQLSTRLLTLKSKTDYVVQLRAKGADDSTGAWSESSAAMRTTDSEAALAAAEEAKVEFAGLVEGKLASLSDEARAFCTAETLARFLSARDFNVDAAWDMLSSTLQWREENIVGKELRCERCAADPSSHCFLQIGYDKLKGRPVMYICPGRAADQDVDATVYHLLCKLEELIPVDSMQQWIWVVDFGGFSLSHATNLRMGSQFAQLFAHHYPQRMGMVLLVNPPLVFNLMWTAVKGFMNSVMLAKVVFAHGEERDVWIEKLMPRAAADWLYAVFDTKAQPGTLPPAPALIAPDEDKDKEEEDDGEEEKDEEHGEPAAVDVSV